MAWRRFVICLGMLLVAITRCHCVALSKVSLPNPSVIWKFNSRGNSTQIKTKEAHSLRGRLFIGRRLRQSATLEEHLVDTDYQSDMGWDEAEAYFKAQADGAANSGSASVQKLMQTEPNVECTGDSMKLNVQGSFSTPGALFLVDRGSSLAPLPLSELPSSCGYTLNMTQRDLVLVAPYDGCFVSLEEESYVLSLHWWGIPVRMSCPVRRRPLYNPPRVTCNTAGMVVKTDWASPVDKIQVNLNGQWKPLMEVLPRCGFGFEFASNPAGVAISIRYVPCVGVKDGIFTLGLAGDGAVQVSCPNVQIVDGPSKGVLPTVAPLKYPNIPPAGTSEGQKQNSINQPPKNPAAPDNQHPQPYPFPYFTRPLHPSAMQAPDQFPPYYQNPFYPSAPGGPSQKPASPTSKTEVQEPVTGTKPPKTHDSKKPVGPEGQHPQPYPFPYNFWPPHPSASEGQNPWPNQFPYYFWPPQLSQGPDLPTLGVPQKPASTTSKTEGQEPVTQPKPPKTDDSKNPVTPEGQHPQPYPFPYNFWPPHPSASQTPDPFPPYYQNPFYPPSLPHGPSQKPASPTSKTEVQEPVTGTKPPKTHDSKKLVGPEGQNPWPYPFPYFTRPLHPSAAQAPDQFPPYYQNPFYPTSAPDGPSQKPASPTSKTEVQEPVTGTKPPKTHDSKKPVGPEGQNPWPYPFPYFTRPLHPSAVQAPDQFPPYYQNPFYPPSAPDGPSQKPASPTSKTEAQEPVTGTKPPKTHDSKKPVGPEGQNPWPYQFPYYFWPPQLSQGPDLPTPGVPQKPASTTSKTEGQEPVTGTKPPKTHDSKKPVGPEGENPWPYQFPYFTRPLQPSAAQAPDQFPPYYQNPFYPPSAPDGPSQKPASPTSKTEVQEPVTGTKPPKTHDSKKPVGPEGQNPWPYQFPYYFWPPQLSQGPDLPTRGVLQKPASTTSKTEVQEPVTGTKPPKSGVTKYLPPSDPLATVTQTKPSKSKPGLPFNPLVQCPEKCLSGLSECCVSFNYHHHDHFIYPPKDEEIQGTPRTGIPDTIEASHDTIVNPPLQNEAEDWHNFLSQAVKYASKGNKVFAYSPPEGILNQDLPQSFEPSQSEWVPPTYIQQYEQPTNELQTPDKKQSQSQTPVNQGQFTILEPGMLQYNMFQDAKASSGDSTDYSEAVHPLSNSWKFEKRTSEGPFSNGYVLLEHGPPGSDPSSPKLAARGLGRSHTHLTSEPLSHYQQSKGKSHPPQPGNQMDAMYRSEDRMTGQEPHYYVPLSDPARIGQFQSNHNLGQVFKGRRSSVDGDPNGDVNQPFPRNGHGK